MDNGKSFDKCRLAAARGMKKSAGHGRLRG
jgi:hypothetical protein